MLILELLIFLPTPQSILQDSPQLLYSFEELKLQAMVMLYLIGFLLVCVPPHVPHLQLVPFIYHYHWLSILSPIVNFFVLVLQLSHLEYHVLLLLKSMVLFLIFPMLFIALNIFHLLYYIRWFRSIWTTIYKGWKTFLKANKCLLYVSSSLLCATRLFYISSLKNVFTNSHHSSNSTLKYSICCLVWNIE
jgi:hypothetical protein